MNYIPETLGDRVLVLTALGVFFISFELLWNYRPASHGPGSAERIGEVETDVPIRRRHAGTLAWSAIEGSSSIYFRDIVYTPAGATAVVKLTNGKQVPLPPDSLVQFDEVTVANIEIALRETAKKKNVFRLLPMPKTEQNKLLPDPFPLALLFDDLNAQLKALLQQPHQRLSEVRRPKLEFKLDTLADFQVRLIQPRNKGTYNLRRDSFFTMSWSAVPLPNVIYNLEIARNPEFRKKLPFTSDTNVLQIQLQNPGTYYWRVRAVARDQVLTSDTGQFEMSLRGGVTDLAREMELPKATLNGFTTEIAADSDFSQLVETGISPEPKCKPRTHLARKAYFCRVKDVSTGRLVKEYRLSPERVVASPPE